MLIQSNTQAAQGSWNPSQSQLQKEKIYEFFGPVSNRFYNELQSNYSESTRVGLSDVNLP